MFLQGFLTAASQLILQLIVLGLGRGVLIHSLSALVNYLVNGPLEDQGDKL